MPNITIQQVIDAARVKLMDNASVSAGRIVTDAEMLQFMQLALLEMNQILRVVDTPFTRREISVLITPLMNRIPLFFANYLPDVSQIGEIFERKVSEFSVLTGMTDDGVDFTYTTSAPHSFSVGDELIVMTTAFPQVNGTYVVNAVPTGSSVKAGPGLPRAVALGGATDGYLAKGVGAWNPVVLVDNLVPLDTPVESIAAVQMGDYGLRFNPVIGNRLLKLECFPGVAAIPALTDRLLIADSISYLAGKCAMEAHKAKGGNAERISALARELYGISEDPGNIEGGSAGLLRRGFILQSQWKRRVRRRFRDIRQPNYPAFVRF